MNKISGIFLFALLILSVGGYFVWNSREKNLPIVIPNAISVSPHSAPPSRLEIPHNVSLESIFEDDHSWVATLSAEHIRSLLATGDIMPARSVNSRTVQRNDFLWPYRNVQPLPKADLLYINLETPLVENCPLSEEGMIFCGDARNVEGLKYIRVDVASLANNHAGNFGKPGIDQTIAVLNGNNIAVTGVDKAITKNVRGKTFAFLSYNDIGESEGILKAQEEKIKSDIAAIRDKADILVVQFHWGTEYQDMPDHRQKELGRFTVESGADLIIGNHPHWIQPIEFKNGKLITYAHGNFIFDQMWSEETKLGVLGKYTFYNDDLVDVEYFPIKIYEYGQPKYLLGAEKLKVLDKMKQNSLRLRNKL